MSYDHGRQRFAIDDSGMRELYVDNPPWRLLKELVQNVWDEAPHATCCKVTIRPGDNSGETVVHVEDDGPGFSDLLDTYTLMKHTDKRYDPAKRGRFNVGEKEFISVALEAEVDTVGYTVRFPREGGRKVSKNGRERGTVVSAVMPWRHSQIPELESMLARFQPSQGCGMEVNGKKVSLPGTGIPASGQSPDSHPRGRSDGKSLAGKDRA